MRDDRPPTADDRGLTAALGRRSSVVLASAVFALAAVVMLQRAATVGYNTNEGQRIATAQYFELVFLEGTLGGPAWEETYWTLTQPPIARYILGAAIWLSGNPVPRLDLTHRIEEVRGPDRERYWDPRTYTNERQLAEERRVERPRPAVLTAARIPMALFGAGAILLLFLLGRALAGTVAGLVAALGLLWAPLSLTLLPRAHAEAPLLFFSLLGLYLGVRAATHPVGGTRASPSRTGDARVAPTVMRGLWAGVATGLATATKLSALLGLAALGGFAAWSLAAHAATKLRAGVPSARSSDLGARNLAAARWSALATVVGLLASVAVNPFLWPDPIGRTAAMLEFRRQELVGQRALNANDAVPESLAARATLLLERTFVGEAPFARRTGLPLDAALALVGAGVLARRAFRARGEGGLVGPEAFALVWIGTFLAGTAPNLGLDWQRYYLPTVALGLILVGVGAEALVGATVRAARARRSRSSACATAPPVTTPSSGSAGSW